ncbi:MAG: lysophospholipid acyltransferase family protein [Betaproteobacteria bacterium]
MLLAGLAIGAGVFPWQSQRARNRIIRRWSRVLLWVCGLRLRVTGVPLDPQIAATGMAPWSQGRLVLANHISWIDVFAIDATIPSRFVAKAEIGRWPVAGWLVTLSGVLYVERGRRHAVAAINHKVRERLHVGETVVVFPEGTTTDGSTLLPFHSNMVAPALELGCELWPVALRYTEDGTPSDAAAFVGDMNLVTCLWNIFCARKLEVEVALLPPLRAAAGETRHHLTQRARAAIAAQLGLPAEEPTPAPAPDGADKPPAAASAAASAVQ